MPKDLSDFLASVLPDRSPIVRQFLKTLGDRYVNEIELCRSTKVAFQDLPRYRELFAAHVVPARNAARKPATLWAGTPKLAKKMREVSAR